MTLRADEFIRRFLLHVLPGGFRRIRHFGFLANAHRTARLVTIRALLAVPAPAVDAPPTDYRTRYALLTGRSLDICSCCGGAWSRSRHSADHSGDRHRCGATAHDYPRPSPIGIPSCSLLHAAGRRPDLPPSRLRSAAATTGYPELQNCSAVRYASDTSCNSRHQSECSQPTLRRKPVISSPPPALNAHRVRGSPRLRSIRLQRRPASQPWSTFSSRDLVEPSSIPVETTGGRREPRHSGETSHP